MFIDFVLFFCWTEEANGKVLVGVEKGRERERERHRHAPRRESLFIDFRVRKRGAERGRDKDRGRRRNINLLPPARDLNGD